MSQKLGAAIVGTGWVSGEHIKAYQGNPHAEVRAIVSRDKARAEAKAYEFSLLTAGLTRISIRCWEMTRSS